MIYLLELSVLWGLCAAIIAEVYSVVLPLEDTPLDGWFLWLKEWKERGGWRSWIASPLGGCEKCTAGQLAIWSCTIVVPWTGGALFIWLHVVCACWAVIFAIVLTPMIRWLKNRI